MSNMRIGQTNISRILRHKSTELHNKLPIIRRKYIDKRKCADPSCSNYNYRHGEATIHNECQDTKNSRVYTAQKLCHAVKMIGY